MLLKPGCAGAQSELPLDRNVLLNVSITSNQRQFRIGELIPLTLTFSANLNNRYSVNTGRHERSGGNDDEEQFSVMPADGAVDPLPSTPAYCCGGLIGYKEIGPDTWSMTLYLNDWVRFTKSGDYHLTVKSRRVGIKSASTPLSDTPVTVQSSEIQLTLVAATTEWRKSEFEAAVVALNQPRPEQPAGLEAYVEGRKHALEMLRALDTPDAVRELARQLVNAESGTAEICTLGLVGASDRRLAHLAMLDVLRDPETAITSQFLYAMGRVGEDPLQNDRWREEERQAVEELVAAVPNKKGKAAAASLGTALQEAWNNGTLPTEVTNRLMEQVVAIFDQLPIEMQNSLLTFGWDKIRGPAMVPLLRRLALAYRDYPDTREMGAFQSLQASGTALQHWYELDPAGARPAVIAEIVRPRPRYDARVLGFLPDKTLPEADAAFAEHLGAGDQLEGGTQIVSLIARYATDAILPQVLEKIDPKLGKWRCDIQDPALAYVLRVSPELARPRIEKALTSTETGCRHGLFQQVADIHFDPVLEEIGVRRLNDPDPQTAMTAATMLGKYGSPSAEQALWERYTRWASEHGGAAAENVSAKPGEAEWVDQGLGQNLLQAIIAGKSWLTDAAKLQRLDQMTREPELRPMFERALADWQNPPFRISFADNGWPAGLDVNVAQYEFHSLAELNEKLAQFPAGTKFVLLLPPFDKPENEKAREGIKQILAANKLVLAGESKVN